MADRRVSLAGPSLPVFTSSGSGAARLGSGARLLRTGTTSSLVSDMCGDEGFHCSGLRGLEITMRAGPGTVGVATAIDVPIKTQGCALVICRIGGMFGDLRDLKA